MTKVKSILGKTTGSVMNYLMAHNNTEPEAGKGCTVLAWTDRYAYEVMRVSTDKKRVIVQQYLPERINIDKYVETEHQEYKYEKLNGVDKYIVFKWGSWRWEETKVVYTEKGKSLPYDKRMALWSDEQSSLRLVHGLTKLEYNYPVVNILWGERKEYYDYSH